MFALSPWKHAAERYGHYDMLLQEIGYTSEIGYQTFLYSNVEGVRRLFMYLVERLPREGAAAADEPAGEL